MGKRGPKKAPVRLLELHGSSHASGRSEPVLASGAPEVPDWLVGEALAEWHRQIADLEARGLCSATFRPALAMFCQAWGQFVDAERMVQEHGATTKTPAGCEIVSPWCGIRNKSRLDAVKLGQQFGFSPSTIADVSGQAPEVRAPDPFEEMLERRTVAARQKR